MSDCFSIKHSKYISSFLLLFLLFSLSHSLLYATTAMLWSLTKGTAKETCVETLACLAGYYPLSALNDNEGLTRFTQLAWHHTLVTWPCLWHTVQKLNFHSDAHKQQKGMNQREYISFGSRLNFSLSPTDWRWGWRGKSRRRWGEHREERKTMADRPDWQKDIY